MQQALILLNYSDLGDHNKALEYNSSTFNNRENYRKQDPYYATSLNNIAIIILI